MEQKTLTERVVDLALSTPYGDIPDLARIKAKDAVIDYLGCIMGAADSMEASIIDGIVSEAAAPAEATLVGSWVKTSAYFASMSNAYRCHILEFDDGAGGMHTGATILPAAIAAAEKYHVSGQKLIHGIVFGIEIACRISLAAGTSQNKYWHSTGTCGVFGAAMAAGLIMGLNRDQLVWALGNAGTMAAGLWQFNLEGAMSKYLHCAKAASDGLLAAMLAKRNYTGARKIIEGEKGFIISHSEEKHPERFFDTLGRKYMIDMLSIKPYPSCSHTHAAISASLQLREKYRIKPEEIEKIIITTYKDATITARNNKQFRTPREAKFSISCGAASALLRGRVDKNTFSPESITAPELLALAAKTEIKIDDEMTKNYPNQWAAAVEVQTPRGSFRIVEKEPWGDLKDAIPPEKLKVKYSQLAEGVIEEPKAELLWNRCLGLEDLDDVNSLFEDIAG